MVMGILSGHAGHRRHSGVSVVHSGRVCSVAMAPPGGAVQQPRAWVSSGSSQWVPRNEREAKEYRGKARPCVTTNRQ